MPLDDLRTLGRSGLAISPLALGTMTFGMARWGSGEADSRAVFDAYVEAGGNFVDTADVYSGGESEAMLGRFIAERGLRDQLVLATKAGFSTGPGAHAGGSGAKHLHKALEGSLRRLQTDHVDLYWLHVWDGVTPAGELLETMSGLVRAGKIRHWGISNSPAWYVAEVAALAVARGRPGPIAMQYFHSLVNRDIEDEHLPLAASAGLGMVPWSPLAFGFLTGKYQRAAVEAAAPRASGLPRDAAEASMPRDAAGAQGAPEPRRLDGDNPFGDSLFTERNWAILETLRRVASGAGESMARVAMAWVTQRPGVTATLLGASSPAQVADNIAALSITLSAGQRAELDAASAPASRMLYSMFTPAMRQQVISGGSRVRVWGR